MEKREFYISRDKLKYNISSQKISSYILEEHKDIDIPSVSYLSLKYEDEIYLPSTIFQNKLTPLQTIVKYLKENLNKSNKQIALLLNRDPRATWLTYKSIEKKKAFLFEETEVQIPVSIFKDRRISTLEALAQFLRNLGMKYSEIARLLNKDPRTIWTVCSRAKKKLGKDKKDEYKK
ncbi:hypothetical protein KY348_03545 [Candidatus Woesearchaeota archaeon]|nr:hypothetical protein [Candidatus Woesearchaeota archaeon]